MTSNETVPEIQILLIEDNAADARLIQLQLKEARWGAHDFSAAKVTTAVSLRESLDLLSAGVYQLVLLDLSLPDSQGLDTIQAIHTQSPLIPVVVLTGLADQEVGRQTLEKGAQDYLVKGEFDPLLLARTIEFALERDRLQGELRRQNLELSRAYEQIQLQYNRLTTLRAIDITITSSLDIHVILPVLIQHVIDQLKVDAVCVLLYNNKLQTLEYAAGRGFYNNTFVRSRLNMGQGHAGRAALERTLVQLPNLSLDRQSFSQQLALGADNFKSYIGMPLITKGMVVGVMELYHRSAVEHDADWLEFLEVLATQTAIAIENCRLFEDLQVANTELVLAVDSTIEGWARNLDIRTNEAEGHTRRVTELTLTVARSMGVNENDMAHIRRGAMLHDIGKLVIPDTILQKADTLTPEEWEVMKRHPIHSYELISPIAYLRPALDIPYCHHERWDGSGYPRGISGEQIPLAARIFSVVEMWDALHTDRLYRKAWPEGRVVAAIQGESGKQFDPQVVQTFINLNREVGFTG